MAEREESSTIARLVVDIDDVADNDGTTERGKAFARTTHSTASETTVSTATVRPYVSPTTGAVRGYIVHLEHGFVLGRMTTSSHLGAVDAPFASVFATEADAERAAAQVSA